MVQFKSCFPSELWDFSCSWKIIQHLRFTLTPPSGASNTPNLIFIFIVSLLPCDPLRRWERAERFRERIIQERAASNRARCVSGFNSQVFYGCRAVVASLFHHQTIIVTFIQLNIMVEVVALPFRYCAWTHNLFPGIFPSTGCFPTSLGWNSFSVGQCLSSDGAGQNCLDGI